MKILFVSGYGHLPQRFGGLESNTHDLARSLQRRGHKVAVLCGLEHGGYLGLRARILKKLYGEAAPADYFLGYATYRRWDPLKALPKLIAAIRPDFAIAQPCNHVPLAAALIRLSVPALVYLHDVEWEELGDDPREHPQAHYISNSKFVADRFRQRFSLSSTVIPPLFRARKYAGRPKANGVTFVNPTPQKGLGIARELVRRCPEIPFTFVRSWKLSAADNAELQAFAGQHPNLRLIGPLRNMRRVYRHTSILLAPSLIEEAWGRVVSEAHFSGIPVIASNRGGLPQAVGPGGILLDPEADIEMWVTALRRLWSDQAFYGKISQQALAYSHRPEIHPDRQVMQLLELGRSAIAYQNIVAKFSKIAQEPRDGAYPSLTG